MLIIDATIQKSSQGIQDSQHSPSSVVYCISSFTQIFKKEGQGKGTLWTMLNSSSIPLQIIHFNFHNV